MASIRYERYSDSALFGRLTCSVVYKVLFNKILSLSLYLCSEVSVFPASAL